MIIFNSNMPKVGISAGACLGFARGKNIDLRQKMIDEMNNNDSVKNVKTSRLFETII